MLKKPGKQYGLIKKKKPETKLVASKLSFFNDDDDEDEGLDEKKRIEKELKKTAAQKKVNKQTQVNISSLDKLFWPINMIYMYYKL